MKKEAIRGRVRHRGSDKLILSKRFIAFLQEIRKEACAAKKKPAKPTLEKKVSPASNQNPCLLASFVIRKNLVQTYDDGLFMYTKKNGGRIKMKATEPLSRKRRVADRDVGKRDLEATIKGLKLLASHSPIGPQGIHFAGS